MRGLLKEDGVVTTNLANVYWYALRGLRIRLEDEKEALSIDAQISVLKRCSS